MTRRTHIERHEAKDRPANNRSKLSTRVDALLNVDGRLPLPRLFKDICNDVAIDLGGADTLSTVKLVLIKQFAGLVVLSESMRSEMLQGKEVSLGEMAQVTSALTRLASRIGLDRKAKTVPSIEDYLANKARNKRRPQIIDHDDYDDDE